MKANSLGWALPSSHWSLEAIAPTSHSPTPGLNPKGRHPPGEAEPISSVGCPAGAAAAGSLSGCSITLAAPEKLPLPAALHERSAAGVPMVPSIPACQGLLSLIVVKPKTNSGSSCEGKKRKGKETSGCVRKASQAIKPPHQTTSTRCRGVCSGTWLFQHSEPAWPPAGRTDFSSHLHFCRCDEQDAGEPAARLPLPQVSRRPRSDRFTPSCFSRSGFRALGHQLQTWHSLTCSRLLLPRSTEDKEKSSETPVANVCS